MTDGINIPREVADAEGVPEDLDANLVGPYRFPDPRRRRIAAVLYLILALGLVVGTVWLTGLWIGAVLAGVLSVWHFAAAWPLGLEQEEALERAARAVPFAIGHASAAVTFHGLRARPRWHVVLYSADDPPSQRALVELDAVDGTQVGDPYTEPVPS